MSSTVEQIKDRVDIIDLVSGYMSLQRAGANMKARCPFHSERSPSFTVSPERQSYHCFGCGEHGDIFTFIEKIEGVDFKGALKILAEKAGIEIKYEGPKKSKEELDEREQMFAAMQQAAEFYFQRLQESKEVLKYLESRGITRETIRKFQIGFAPDDWHAAENMLKIAGFNLDTLEKVGLSIKGDKGHYDRFRSRIMFPMRDTAGRVVAFSGRIFGDVDDKTAKYINSPETELYSKSKVLYGFDMAKQAIRKNDFTILVEGQMDLVACHQSGYSNTVAISGTALTNEHCKLLSRMSKNIVLALDADDAGIKAAGRSAIIALANGFDTKVATLPEGKDPADVLQDSELGKWKKIIKDAKHIVEFLLDVYASKNKDDERKFKKRVEEVVLPFVARIQSKIDQDHFIRVVAGKIGVSESTIILTLQDVKLPIDQIKTQEPAKVRSQDYRKQFSPLAMLISIIVWQESVKDASIDVAAIRERVVGLVGKSEFDEALGAVGSGDITYAESMYSTKEAVQAVVAERLEYLRQGTLRSKRFKLTQELQKAESNKDKQLIIELHKDINKVNNELESA
ncbi:MAG: DNA primase [Candidatus Pacebacteria bacterium]|nr:DNA primase [Candidatus Paceibacterota bacterium]